MCDLCKSSRKISHRDWNHVLYQAVYMLFGKSMWIDSLLERNSSGYEWYFSFWHCHVGFIIHPEIFLFLQHTSSRFRERLERWVASVDDKSLQMLRVCIQFQLKDTKSKIRERNWVENGAQWAWKSIWGSNLLKYCGKLMQFKKETQQKMSVFHT